MMNQAQPEQDALLFEENLEKQNALRFLRKHGTGTKTAERIYQYYGDKTIEVVTRNPFELCTTIDRVGFKTADKIACSLGLPKESEERLHIGFEYTFNAISQQGHCGVPPETFIEKAQNLLEVEASRIIEVVEADIARGDIVHNTINEKPCLFLKKFFDMEKKVAFRLGDIQRGSLPWQNPIKEERDALLETHGLHLSPDQQQALDLILTSKVCVLTGGPGMGKTTLVNALVKILKSHLIEDRSVVLCAPTGKAAKNLKDKTGQKAFTIHRTINAIRKAREDDEREAQGFQNNHQAEEMDAFLNAGLIIVDEISMVNIELMHSLLNTISTHSALLLVGDVDQLPAIGAGNVLSDILKSKQIPVARLTTLHRQAALSGIIRNAHRVNNGLFFETMPLTTKPDFVYLEKESQEDIFKAVIKLVSDELPRKVGYDPVRDIQVLSPIKRWLLGIENLNLELQEILNPEEKVVIRFNCRFAKGDKVMQTKNNYKKDVMNGETGIVRDINEDSRLCLIDFDGDPVRSVTYTFDEMEEIILAYAMTIHKSQGSEYPAIVIPLSTSHSIMLRRNLLYTAITRGQKHVFIIGQRRAIDLAIADFRVENRYTKLSEWLQQ
jgi:exodeoxyribonuclease V alpha subunit